MTHTPMLGATRGQRMALEAKAMFDAAEREGRVLSGEERERAAELLDGAEGQLAVERKMHALGLELGPAAPHAVLSGVAAGASFQTPGEAFTASEGYKSIRSAANRPQTWTSGVVEVGPTIEAKGTLLEGTGSPGTGTAGGWLTTPQVVPGVVDKLFQPLTLENLLMSGQATGNSVRYVIEGTATSGAAGVAEGGAKPQSTLAYSTLDEQVKKIATSLKISDEALEDVPAIQQFINGRLALFVRIETERQLLRGTSGGAEVQGLLTSRGVPIYAGGTAAGNKAVQLFKSMNGMRGSAFVEPEWIVMNPADWQDIRLLTDTAGQYFGGGPFSVGPYGGQRAPASPSGQLTGAVDSIWNKAIYVTAAIGAGTAVVGSSAAAQVWSRGGLRVEATNANEDDFFHNLAAIRAERRLALTVFRPEGFVEVRLS